MSTFVDTSALLALLNASDEFHGKADAAWRTLWDEMNFADQGFEPVR